MKLTLPPATKPYLLAISGGGDSMALALLAKQQGVPVLWAHFNHGWGQGDDVADDAAEAFIRQQAKAFGVKLHVGKGAGGRPASNAEAKGRLARYAYFKTLCEQHSYAGVLVAHTATDVAEGFLIRAGKGSGVAGLAAMAPASSMQGVRVLRPLLPYTREELRDFLTQNNQAWWEDPENTLGAQGARNQRAKVRALLPALAKAGVTVHGLAAAAQALARANVALEAQIKNTREPTYSIDEILDKPDEIALRQLGHIIKNHTNIMAPRTSKRVALLARLRTEATGSATLGGLKWRWGKGVLSVLPEAPHG